MSYMHRFFSRKPKATSSTSSTELPLLREDTKLPELEERRKMHWRFCPVCGERLTPRTRPGSVCRDRCESWAARILLRLA